MESVSSIPQSGSMVGTTGIPTGPVSIAPGVEPPSTVPSGVAVPDSVEISGDAADAAAGRVNPKGKATGHARVAQNIEKNVAKLIERETARVVAGGGDAATLESFRAQVEGIAGAYSADPSGSPAKVLSQIRDAVRALRAGESPVEPTEPAPGDGDVVPPVDGEAPAEPVEVPVDGALPSDEPIVVDLSGLRIG